MKTVDADLVLRDARWPWPKMAGALVGLPLALVLGQERFLPGKG